jgi:hypothetical protein
MPVKDEIQEEDSIMRNLQIKTSLEKDTTLNFPWLGNPFRIPWNSAIDSIPDLLNSGIFIGMLFFRS